MATVYKIHPAIGIARVGNSPDDFFIGPERRGEEPSPPGGFKDAASRIKRQAARFRIFAHHDDGTFEEITDAQAQITWTVHLCNKKAAHPDRGNAEPVADLTIDPGPRTLTGPDQRALFDTGTITFSGAATVTVPLGEIRTNDAGQLIVLGGFGAAASPTDAFIRHFWLNPGWYDDIADGPVTASITLRSDSSTPPVVGAWVVTAPPKFAPQIESPITLWDRLFDEMVTFGHLPAPTSTSYTEDIYPLLKSARAMRWVWDVVPAGSHEWVDPVIDDASRAYIASRFKTPLPPNPYPANMPLLYALPTPTQYAHVQNWGAGTFVNDWVGPPVPETSITPDGLDRAALEPCVGSLFSPGIEVGGSSTPYPESIVEPSNYNAAFRLNHAVVGPGDITFAMAVPWQADFDACTADDLGWWPVPRPMTAFRPGETTSVSWDGVVDMVHDWHTLGFIVAQDGGYYETERTEPDSVLLTTPALNFIDVPQGPTVAPGSTPIVREAALAITFEVISVGGPVTLEYAPLSGPSHPQLAAYNTSVTVGPTTGADVALARLWVIFSTSDPPGAIPQQTVVVSQMGSLRQWVITIDGNTVGRETTATALVLDRSGSMSEPSGAGPTKQVAMQQAADAFLALMLAGDGAGVVRYNHNADVLEPIRLLGSGGLTDTGRQAVHDALVGTGLAPSGSTSIGDGLVQGRAILDTAPDAYDHQAIVVLTDGKENNAQYISDVAQAIDDKTYAIGFGTPQNTSAPALQALSGNTGGYLLITGSATGENSLLLHKFFTQILASINTAEVLLDPRGELLPEQVQRVPFVVTAADRGLEAILLTPEPGKVDFRLQSPLGTLLEPWRAIAEPDTHFALSTGTSFFRLRLPMRLRGERQSWSGRWHALLRLGAPKLEGKLDDSPEPSFAAARNVEPGLLLRRPPAARAPGGQEAGQKGRRRGVPYDLVIHGYSGFGLSVGCEQTGFSPGASLLLRAELTESGVPFVGEAVVWAELERPSGRVERITLASAGEGRFETGVPMTEPGVHSARVRARAVSRMRETLARERLVTAAVWRGGDRDAEEAARPGVDRAPPAVAEDPRNLPDHSGGRHDPRLRWLVECLLARCRREARKWRR